MTRADDKLAFLLRFENVAWYEDGSVRILDRRIYPIETKYVTCRTHGEVAQAIADMVTQSGGPYTAAAMGMALAAFEAKALGAEAHAAYMEKAAYTLSHARPTTQHKMEAVTNGALAKMRQALAGGAAPAQLPDILAAHALDTISGNYSRVAGTGRYLAAKVPDGGTVMTQCFAESIVGMLCRALQESGKTVKFICPETRPYLQGARLTASVISDMGFETHIITDNMPGYILKEKKVDLFTSAADVITMDGHVVNKVGTFQIALAAFHWGIPYYVTGAPNPGHPDIASVPIEERDPAQVTTFLGTRVCKPTVSAYYPAFDVTPPRLVSGVVTHKGIYPAVDLGRYFEEKR